MSRVEGVVIFSTAVIWIGLFIFYPPWMAQRQLERRSDVSKVLAFSEEDYKDLVWVIGDSWGGGGLNSKKYERLLRVLGAEKELAVFRKHIKEGGR